MKTYIETLRIRLFSTSLFQMKCITQLLLAIVVFLALVEQRYRQLGKYQEQIHVLASLNISLLIDKFHVLIKNIDI